MFFTHLSDFFSTGDHGENRSEQQVGGGLGMSSGCHFRVHFGHFFRSAALLFRCLEWLVFRGVPGVSFVRKREHLGRYSGRI